MPCSARRGTGRCSEVDHPQFQPLHSQSQQPQNSAFAEPVHELDNCADACSRLYVAHSVEIFRPVQRYRLLRAPRPSSRRRQDVSLSRPMTVAPQKLGGMPCLPRRSAIGNRGRQFQKSVSRGSGLPSGIKGQKRNGNSVRPCREMRKGAIQKCPSRHALHVQCQGTLMICHLYRLESSTYIHISSRKPGYAFLASSVLPQDHTVYTLQKSSE